MLHPNGHRLFRNWIGWGTHRRKHPTVRTAAITLGGSGPVEPILPSVETVGLVRRHVCHNVIVMLIAFDQRLVASCSRSPQSCRRRLTTALYSLFKALTRRPERAGNAPANSFIAAALTSASSNSANFTRPTTALLPDIRVRISTQSSH